MSTLAATAARMSGEPRPSKVGLEMDVDGFGGPSDVMAGMLRGRLEVQDVNRAEHAVVVVRMRVHGGGLLTR
jgi:hypothetical protein